MIIHADVRTNIDSFVMKQMLTYVRVAFTSLVATNARFSVDYF